MRDLKYIVKRILIGVGIVLVLGFINSAKASALDLKDIDYTDPNYNMTFHYSLDLDSYDHYFLAFQYRNSTNYIDYVLYYWNGGSTSAICDSSNLGSFNNCYDFINGTSLSDRQYGRFQFTVSNATVHQYFYRCSVNWSTGNTSNCNTSLSGTTTLNNSYFILVNMSTLFAKRPNLTNGTFANSQTMGNQGIVLSNFDFNYNDYTINKNYYNNNNFSEPDLPTIESLQPHKNIQNGILYSYQFSPKFSNFDTTNYKYQWKLGHDSGWNDFEENEQLLNFRQDGELYVRIVDLSDNSVIANENFVIHGVGQASSSSIFNINFSSTYSTSSDSSSKLTMNIDEVKVGITFFPESDKYRYQYKFIPEGTSQSDVIWTTSATTDISYTTNENGTIYARITDSEYNSLFDKTYTINNIGSIGPAFSSESTNNFFSNISYSLNFSGPISSLINIPLKLISTISTGVAGGNTCTDYPLGSLFGTNLVLPCVNIKQHLGNSLYTTIDLIIACCMIYYIIKMFGELYTNLLFMSKNPIHDLGRRGD